MKNKKYKDIKTLADAFKATGRPETPSFDNIPEDMREYFRKQYEVVVITEAINGGWKADWGDSDQNKWQPWFHRGSSGFAFDDTSCYYSTASAGDASRLCFKSYELARYAGATFTEIYSALITK